MIALARRLLASAAMRGRSRALDHDAEPGSDGRERSSGTREVPVSMRGRRVMTRLYLLIDDLRMAGRAPSAVTFSSEDERMLLVGAEQTFGVVGAAIAVRGPDAFREFLRAWVGRAIGVTVSFGADETRVH